MREFKDYTDEEVLAFTDEQVKDIIDLECAIAGVKLIERPVMPEVEEIPRDKTIWKLGGFTFDRKGDAEKIASLLQDMPMPLLDYNWNIGSEYTYAKDEPSDACPTISEERVFSEGQYDKFKVELKHKKEVKASFDKRKEAYDQSQRERKDIAQPIWERINDLKNDRYRQEQMRLEFEKYLGLSEGNKTIAMNFLRRAHNISNELAEELVPGYFKTEGADPETPAEEEEEE